MPFLQHTWISSLRKYNINSFQFRAYIDYIDLTPPTVWWMKRYSSSWEKAQTVMARVWKKIKQSSWMQKHHLSLSTNWLLLRHSSGITRMVQEKCWVWHPCAEVWLGALRMPATSGSQGTQRNILASRAKQKIPCELFRPVKTDTPAFAQKYDAVDRYRNFKGTLETTAAWTPIPGKFHY